MGIVIIIGAVAAIGFVFFFLPDMKAFRDEVEKERRERAKK